MTSPAIQTILVPVDFSEITPSVVEHAVYFARLLSARLILFHAAHLPPLAEASTWLDPVISPNVEQDIIAQLTRGARDKLAKTVAECESAGVTAEFLVRQGLPFDEILQAAQEKSADLIVLGTHGRTGFKFLVLGSVAARVVRMARCPVLCIPPKSEGPADGK